MKPLGVALLVALAATAITAAPARTDCGDPGQPPCTGPVPTPDEVAGLLNQLTDPATPDPVKSGLVQGGLAPDQLSDIDDHGERLRDRGYLPIDFVVTDIQPAPNNVVGSTVSVPGQHGTYGTRPGPIVLVAKDGRWLLDHDTTTTFLARLWYNTSHRNRYVPFP